MPTLIATFVLSAAQKNIKTIFDGHRRRQRPFRHLPLAGDDLDGRAGGRSGGGDGDGGNVDNGARALVVVDIIKLPIRRNAVPISSTFYT